MKMPHNLPLATLLLLLRLTAHSAQAQASPLAQDYVQVFHNPNPEFYVEGPGLVRLDDGALIAVVPVVPRNEWSVERRATQSVSHILRSVDHGRSWQRTSELPYYSAIPWVHHGSLYLFANKGGTKYRNDDLLLLRSTDGGHAWSAPVTLFTGHFWNCHTGMVIRGDKLYWAIDDLALGNKRGPRALCGDLARDPLNPQSWRLSDPVPFPGVPEALTNPAFDKLTSQYLEPNVFEVAGRLQVLMTVKPKRQSTAGLAAVLDLHDNGTTLDLKFRQFHPMPGGQLKFCVLWDDVSRLYWATANLVVDSQGVNPWWKAAEDKGVVRYASGLGGNDRRFLMLLYGIDGLNWFQAGCIAQAPRVSQSFMYARPVIDGNDLAIIARSSIHAPNQHDADYATFHRVKDFRKLALKLIPEPESP